MEVCLEKNILCPACSLTSLSNLQWHSTFKPQICICKLIHLYVVCANGEKTICPGHCFLLCRKHVYLINNRVLISYVLFYATVLALFCISMHIYICKNSFKYVWVYTYTYIYMCTYISMWMCTYMYVSVCVYMYVPAHTHIQIYFYIWIHSCTHTHTHLNHFLRFFCISIMWNLFHNAWSYYIWRKQVAVTKLIN